MKEKRKLYGKFVSKNLENNLCIAIQNLTMARVNMKEGNFIIKITLDTGYILNGL